MATPRLAPIVPRLRRLAVLGLVATLLIPTAGCHHRRSAMRPVFAEPAPNSTIIRDDPIPSIVPSRPDDKMGDFDVSPRLTPIVPPVDSRVQPSRGYSPPVPQGVDEPDLKIEKAPKANIKGPELNPPSAMRSTATTRQTASTKSRQSTLRERVRPYVNDADDLFQPPKADRPWKFVVVHHSANPTGSYDQIDRDHRQIQGWDGCGYHFVIGNGTDSPDGQIEVARRWSNQKHGLHCRNGKTPEVNEYGIGI